jgi:hypothetical protein
MSRLWITLYAYPGQQAGPLDRRSRDPYVILATEP